MRWTQTKTRSGLRPFNIVTEHEYVSVWGYVNGHIGAHNPTEDNLIWDFTHLPTGRRIGAVDCDARTAEYMTYEINYEVTGLDTEDLDQVRAALVKWAAPLSVPDKLKSLRGAQ